MPEFVAASRVAAYAALDDELPTLELTHLILESGRVLLLPRIRGDRLEFTAVEALTRLRPGRWGIPESDRSDVAGAWRASDLVLVPGVAFDRRGGRIGRGGGYYDRSLPSGLHRPAIFGLAFAWQIVEEVPMASGDRWVDGVVTPDAVVRVARRDPDRDSG